MRKPGRSADAAVAAAGVIDCVKCKIVKPLEEFPKARTNRKGQPRYDYCKICHSEVQRVLRLKKFFNMTPADYDTIFEKQGGVCAICERPPRTMRLAIDHDHKTGLIRGLLCTFCNRVIGIFRDDIQRFEHTVSYLKVPPATLALGGERYGIKGRTSNKAATRKRLNKDLIERPKKNQNAIPEEG